MAKLIMSHRVTRGSLVRPIRDVQSLQSKQALCAASPAHALPDLQAQRAAALALMRATAGDLKAFAAASKEEAALAAQIRRARRHRDGKDVPLTPEDKATFHCEYRIADRTDAEVLRLQLQFGRGYVLRCEGMRS